MANAKTVAPALTAEQKEQAINQMMDRLRNPASGKSLSERIDAVMTKVVDVASDAVADSGDNLARIGRAFVSATDNMADAYAMEGERQLRRRAVKLLAKVDSQLAIR